MSKSTMGAFLLPEGFAPPPLVALVREGSVLGEAGRYALRSRTERRTRRATPYVGRVPVRVADPVLLVPGFLAGDTSLSFMGRALRAQGFRTYRSAIRANIGCTLDAAGQLEARLESIAARRGSRVQIVGHSLGGMLARGVAVRRPDLVSGIITMGSPMMAPGAHHGVLTRSVDVLVRLNRAGLAGLMSEDCVAGACARQSFEESRLPLAEDVGFTAIYSKRDGIVDWRACVDPVAEAVEVTASHVGMAVDPRVIDHVLGALRRRSVDSVVEVDRGVSA
ncbi:esterase/lipase family protein [Nocardioides marmotae]|uniref:esterase/lipase family protein n=1 Tax=Nocardioides marmotae TaxID=2663857 RepID=UPI0012B5BC58|nr:alpha/beta fold hydrolase [Nocardioides marmotae]MBC9734934.1 alpha/beta hydrolase [Nocardioides marmotae]MTB86033.1 alpha/beta hydrolase [Nocardioides marmotae]